MKKVLSFVLALGVIFSMGLFVGCKNNKTQTKAEDFTFTYVKESATKTTEESNYNIKIDLSVKNEKNEDNKLLASKFVLKQTDNNVSTSVWLGKDAANKVQEQTLTSMKCEDITLNIVTANTVKGECALYYGETKLFVVNI